MFSKSASDMPPASGIMDTSEIKNENVPKTENRRKYLKVLRGFIECDEGAYKF